jgi:hypothetical protein
MGSDGLTTVALLKGKEFMKQHTPVTGGCLCGAVRYESQEAPTEGYFCHCRTCQKHYGNLFGAVVRMRGSAFRFIKGQPKYYRSSDIARRGFCPAGASDARRDWSGPPARHRHDHAGYGFARRCPCSCCNRRRSKHDNQKSARRILVRSIRRQGLLLHDCCNARGGVGRSALPRTRPFCALAGQRTGRAPSGSARADRPRISRAAWRAPVRSTPRSPQRRNLCQERGLTGHEPGRRR